MNHTNKLLAIALATQAAFAVYTWRPTTHQRVPQHAFFSHSVDDITAIELFDSVIQTDVPSNPLTLKRDPQGQWVLSSMLDFPVAKGKLDWLQTLLEIEVRAPIASKAYNHASLHVATDDYTRKLILHRADGAQTIYLGGGITGRDSIRDSQSEEVFSFNDLSVWDIQTAPSQYFERNILTTNPSKVLVIKTSQPGKQFMAARGERGWFIPEAPEDYMLNQQLAADWIEKATSFRMLDAAAMKAAPEHGLSDPWLTVSWTEELSKGGVEKKGYRLGACDDGMCFASVDNSPWIFRVRKPNFREAALLNLTNLRGQPKVKAPQEKRGHGKRLQDIGRPAVGPLRNPGGAMPPHGPGGAPHGAPPH